MVANRRSHCFQCRSRAWRNDPIKMLSDIAVFPNNLGCSLPTVVWAGTCGLFLTPLSLACLVLMKPGFWFKRPLSNAKKIELLDYVFVHFFCISLNILMISVVDFLFNVRAQGILYLGYLFVPMVLSSVSGSLVYLGAYCIIVFVVWVEFMELRSINGLI